MKDDRFYDGLQAVAHAARIRLVENWLEIAAPDGALIDRWPLADLKVIDANTVTGAMTIGRLSDPTPRLVLHDSPERRNLLAAAPHLASWRARAIRRGLVVGGAWMLAGLAIAAIAYFGWRDASIALARFVPKSWEQRMGANIHETLTENLTLCTKAEGQKALTKLVARLSSPGLKDNPVTIDVVVLKLPNALALPGNHILLTSGLIDLAQSPDMISGVLAHEMGHLDLNHPMQGLVRNLGVAATASLIFGGSGIGDVAYLMTVLSYSRDMEAEADRRALELLHGAGLRADGLAAFFDVMRAREDNNGVMPDWLSTHPGLEDRAEATKVDSTGATSMDPAEWKAVQAICKL